MNYLTQKAIMRFFRDNTDINELKVYISFVGYYTIHGRRGSSSGFKVIEPTYITFKYDRTSFMHSLLFDDIDNEIEKEKDGMSRMFSANRNSNPLYPLNGGIVSHFENAVDMFDNNDEKIEWDGAIIEKIKFFKEEKDSELNFVVLLRNHLEHNDLIQALSTYDRILDKHTITDPSSLLKNI